MLLVTKDVTFVKFHIFKPGLFTHIARVFIIKGSEGEGGLREVADQDSKWWGSKDSCTKVSFILGEFKGMGGHF